MRAADRVHFEPNEAEISGYSEARRYPNLLRDRPSILERIPDQTVHVFYSDLTKNRAHRVILYLAKTPTFGRIHGIVPFRKLQQLRFHVKISDFGQD